MSASIIEKLSLMLVLGASILKYEDHTTLLEIETPFADVSATAVVAFQAALTLPCSLRHAHSLSSPQQSGRTSHHSC